MGRAVIKLGFLACVIRGAEARSLAWPRRNGEGLMSVSTTDIPASWAVQTGAERVPERHSSRCGEGVPRTGISGAEAAAGGSDWALVLGVAANTAEMGFAAVRRELFLTFSLRVTGLVRAGTFIVTIGAGRARNKIL